VHVEPVGRGDRPVSEPAGLSRRRSRHAAVSRRFASVKAQVATPATTVTSVAVFVDPPIDLDDERASFRPACVLATMRSRLSCGAARARASSTACVSNSTDALTVVARANAIVSAHKTALTSTGRGPESWTALRVWRQGLLPDARKARCESDPEPRVARPLRRSNPHAAVGPGGGPGVRWSGARCHRRFIAASPCL